MIARPMFSLVSRNLARTLIFAVALAIGPAAARAGTNAAAAEPTPQHIQRLIAQLGDKDYFVRQRAETALARLGFAAYDALNEAVANPDLEIAARARRLVQFMKVEWSDKSDPAEVKRVLKDYGVQNSEGRFERIEKLGALLDDMGSGALCRLVRYEKSPLLSKVAAIRLLKILQEPHTPADAATCGGRSGSNSVRAVNRERAGSCWRCSSTTTCPAPAVPGSARSTRKRPC